MYKLVNFHQIRRIERINLEMQLSSGQDDMFSSLLLEGLNARVCLAQELQPLYKFWHVHRYFWLQCNPDDRIYLEKAHFSFHDINNARDGVTGRKTPPKFRTYSVFPPSAPSSTSP